MDARRTSPLRSGTVSRALAMLTAPLLLLGLLVVASPARATASTRTATHTSHAARASHRAVGQPSRGYAIPSGSYFSYPNLRRIDQVQIRNRVLYTIQSVWGGPRTSIGTPHVGNGTIRIATWSFDDWGVARALVAARNRGVSVQIVAAAVPNKSSGPWKYLRKRLGSRLYRPGHPDSRETYSFARQCRGSCRGRAGTAHAKYFLFDNVGSHHRRHLVVNTSMNLTDFAVQGQWNQAQVTRSAVVYRHFLNVFRQARLNRARVHPFSEASNGRGLDTFFPAAHGTPHSDPVMRLLNRVRCSGARSGGTGTHTRVRIIQYAIYADRGTWLAKKLRYLWNSGCDVRIIYSLMTRPVLNILRHRSGRGPIPMKQSIVRNGAGEIVKYNHSKWMTISGHWGSNRSAYIALSGSANWANLALRSDEQMQRLSGPRYVRPFLTTFVRTWRQRSSHRPGTTGAVANGRVMVGAPLPTTIPGAVTEDTPPFGHGAYALMTSD